MRRPAADASEVLPEQAADQVGADQRTACGAADHAAAREPDQFALHRRVGHAISLGCRHRNAFAVSAKIALVRVLPVDPGAKREGVAVSDPTGTIAHARTT